MKKLAEMTPEEAAPIMEAWRTMQDREFFSRLDNTWNRDYVGQLDRDIAYRLPPRPEIEVPWGFLPDWVQAVAREQDGAWWGCKHAPQISSDRIGWEFGENHIIYLPLKIDDHGRDWTETLVMRPGSEEGEG